MVMAALGGITYTWFGDSTVPFCTSRTGMAVSRESKGTNMLEWPGARCWMKTNAMPVSAGSPRSSSVTASRPPAEAPMATTGHGSSRRSLWPESLLSWSGKMD